MLQLLHYKLAAKRAFLLACVCWAGTLYGQNNLNGYSVPATGIGLSFELGPGTCTSSVGVIVTYPGSRITLPAGATTFGYLDPNCALGQSAVGFPAGDIPIYTATTDPNVVTKLLDSRTSYNFVGNSSSGIPAGANPGSALVSNGLAAAPIYQVKPIYDVRDYGFVCDGTTYNTSAASTLVASIASNPAKIQGPPGAICGIGDFLWPANVTLDFSTGWQLKTLTDNTTTPGNAAFDTAAGAAGSCQSNNTSPTCAMSVTAVANDAYMLTCMRGFSSGAPVFTSNVATDIIIPIQGSNRSFTSITEGALIPNVVSGAHTFTVTFAANLVGACSAIPISGLGPTPFLDGSGASVGCCATASPMSVSTTLQAGDFVLAWGGNNNTAATCTQGAGFTQPAGTVGNSTNTNSVLCTQYQNVSGAGSITASQSFAPSPAGHTWAYQIIGLRPSSAYNKVLGSIENPSAAQILVNANGTSSQGAVDLTGSSVITTVRPEWWGASPTASATTNTQAIQAAIWGAYGNGPFAPRVNGSGLTQYNRTLYLGSMYNINGELKLYSSNGFKITCMNRLSTGITQTASNARIIDGQSNSYGAFYDCSWGGVASSTLPLIDLDYNGVATPADLKPQFIDFYNNTFGGAGGVAQGVLLAKSGGAAQGSNVNFYDPEFSGFTVAALQVGTPTANAQNALAVTVINGDMQGNNNYGFADYGGGYIQFFGTSMENGGFVGSPGGTNQTGADFFCSAPQGPVSVYDIRSESRKFMWCDQGEIYDSRTIDGGLIPVPGTTFPVGDIITGDRISGDGAYYTVTNNSSAFNGAGTISAPLTASSGTSTTLVDTNQTVAGSVTIGQSSGTATELMTQATSGATGTRLNSPANNATISGTLTSGSFVFGHTAQQATTGVTCTIGSGNTSTLFNCTNFSGTADNSHTWTDTTTLGTFNPSGTPVFASSSPVMLITVATGSPDNTHDWVGGTTGLHYTPTAVPVNQAAWTVNGFTGLPIGIVSGTNVNCMATVTSNTATALTFSGGYSTQYPFTTCAANADTTTQFIVACPWSHSGTVTCGGMQYTYLNEDVVRGGATATTPMQGRIQDSYFAGDQIKIGSGANGQRTIVSNLTVTRQDWYDSTGGATPGNGAGDNDNSWDVRVFALGGLIPMSWSLPHSGGGGTYNGGLHENWGTKKLCWLSGNANSNNPPANTSAAEICAGDPNDPGAGSDAFRNRLGIFSGTGHSAIGPMAPIGLNQNGTDFDLLAGGSTGSGTTGAVNFWISQSGSSGVTPNSGTKVVRINSSGQIESLLSTGTAPFVAASTTASSINVTTIDGVTVTGTPTAGQVPTATSGTAATWQSLPTGPTVVYSTVSAATTGNLGPTTMATAGGAGNTYRFSVYADETVQGASCAGNTTIAVSIGFTDPNSTASTNSFVTYTITNNGSVGQLPLSAPTVGNLGVGGTFRAKASTTVSYSTTYTPNGSCSPAPTYQLYPILEQLN